MVKSSRSMEVLSVWRSWARAAVRLACAATLLLAAATAWAGEYHGQVFYAGVPVPGATVTLSQGAKQITTVTDEQGVYEFPDVADGPWKIEIRMRGFRTLDGTVTVAPKMAQGAWDLQLLGLQQMLAESKVVHPETEPELAQRPEEKPKARTQNGGAAAAPPPEDENAQKAEDGLLINGTSSNANTSRFSLSPAFGNHRPGTRGLYTGGLGAVVDNSIFDARPYSLTGLQVPKGEYSRVTGLATLGGPLNIPHLFYHGPDFFVGYQWTRNGSATTDSTLVPTTAERSGDLSGLLNADGQPVTVYDPATGQPFTGPIPVSQQAAALLQYYPLPNVSGNARYNYETQVLNNTHTDAMESRLEKTLGRRDQVYGGFGFESSRGDTANVFNFRDDTDTLGLDGRANWAHQFHHDMYTTFSYHLTRLRTLARPEFENRLNVSGEAGITGNDQDPQNWGPPSLVFSSGTAGLTDGNSEFNRNLTNAYGVKVSTTHRRHTVMFGFDFRRQQYNEFTEQNPRGSFTFTGAATEAPGSTPGAGNPTGSDLADYLLGIPDASQIAFGNAEKYFRTSAYDAYVTDVFRVMPTFTVNAGIRWEYGAPMSELYGRMVNLDIVQGFTAAEPVLASDPTGPVTGTKYPGTLLRPDYRGWEPRIGMSWRPIPASTLVVRGGYGIYDDTSVYLASAESLAQQAPLSLSVSVANSSACPLTLADGFRNCAGTTADTYAVDPNLRVGYAQDWQLSMQKDFPWALVITATYLGTKGTRGTQEFLPNTYAPGGTNPYAGLPVGFVYRASNGNSTRQAGELQVRRRLRSGLTATADYTWSKALDDDAQVGEQGHVEASEAAAPVSDFANNQPPAATLAQNWLNLAGERGLSTFDQRNVLKGTLQYTTGMGLGGETLLSGWRGTLLKEWTVLTSITAASGTPETPVLLEGIPGTGFSNLLRPDVTGKPLYAAAQGYYLNAAAFATPVAGQWGNARRNSITGPDQFSLDSALARTFRLKSQWNLDVRAEATNLLNHAAWTGWNTTVNSTVFGLPAAANPMRSLQLTGRLRF
ncbi:MAG TPA: carboxypeptidase regulatory-like domain-containing protein [Acidobacteriaceae bacterium]|nr:carboxypeptidase regulatory-like domain-containing protein [Acidobacteriaceae bacterium]